MGTPGRRDLGSSSDHATHHSGHGRAFVDESSLDSPLGDPARRRPGLERPCGSHPVGTPWPESRWPHSIGSTAMAPGRGNLRLSCRRSPWGGPMSGFLALGPMWRTDSALSRGSTVVRCPRSSRSALRALVRSVSVRSESCRSCAVVTAAFHSVESAELVRGRHNIHTTTVNPSEFAVGPQTPPGTQNPQRGMSSWGRESNRTR